MLRNELSTSASGNFAGLVYKYKRGVIVGRETGSSYYQLNATKFARVNIENTGLELYMPLVKSTFEKKGDSDIPWGRGVIPDYKIEIEYDEFLNGNNKGLEYTLELIDNIKNKRIESQ